MTPAELVEGFRSLGPADRPLLWDIARGWREQAALVAGARRWRKALRPEAVARRLVWVHLHEPCEQISALLALWEMGAIAVLLDPSESPQERLRVGNALRAAAMLHDGGVESFEKARRYRDEHLLLGKLTSGSTGAPKLYLFRAAEMVADARQIAQTMGLRADDINLCAIPLGHSYALGNVLMPLLLHGMRCAVASSHLPQALACEIEASQATVFPATPALLNGLVRARVEPKRLRSLRLVISAGARLAPELTAAFRERFGLGIHNFYGSTETGGIAFDRTCEASETGRAVGTPLAGVKVSLSVRGRVRVASASVFTSGNRTLSGGTGSFLMEDHGTWNEHGELVLHGHRGGMLKLGARRLAAESLRAPVLQRKGVREVFVTVIEAPQRPLLAMAVESANTTAAEHAAISGLLKEALPAWQRPRRLVLWEAFPRTARGKLDRAALQARLEAAR